MKKRRTFPAGFKAKVALEALIEQHSLHEIEMVGNLVQVADHLRRSGMC